MIKGNDLKNIGFSKVKHLFIDSYTIDIGRDRTIDISSPSTPNEMIFISNHDPDDFKKIEDIIVLRNYDYDGYTSLSDLENIVNLLKTQKKNK